MPHCKNRVIRYRHSTLFRKTPATAIYEPFDDNEPYPLLEVVELLSERIRGQEAEFKKLPSEGLEWAIAKIKTNWRNYSKPTKTN